MMIGYIYNGAFSIVSKHEFDDQFFFARDSNSQFAINFSFCSFCVLFLLKNSVPSKTN
jgi:hypothetical protein